MTSGAEAMASRQEHAITLGGAEAMTSRQEHAIT